MLRPSLLQSRTTPVCKGQCVGPLEATSIFLPTKTLLAPLTLQGRRHQFCGSHCAKIAIRVREHQKKVVCLWRNVLLAAQILKNLCHLMAGINQDLT